MDISTKACPTSIKTTPGVSGNSDSRGSNHHTVHGQARRAATIDSEWRSWFIYDNKKENNKI